MKTKPSGSTKAAAPPSRLLSVLSSIYYEPCRQPNLQTIEPPEPSSTIGLSSSLLTGDTPKPRIRSSDNTGTASLRTTFCRMSASGTQPHAGSCNGSSACMRGDDPQPDRQTDRRRCTEYSNARINSPSNCSMGYETSFQSPVEFERAPAQTTRALQTVQCNRLTEATAAAPVAAGFRQCPFCSLALPEDQWNDHLAAEIAAVEDESQWQEYIAPPQTDTRPQPAAAAMRTTRQPFSR